MIYELEVSGKKFNCGRMSAKDQFDISFTLGKHGVMELLTSKEMTAGVIQGLMAMPYDEVVKVANTVLSKSMVADSEIKVTQEVFHEDIYGYWQLVAELLVENFREFSVSFVAGQLGMQAKMKEMADKSRALKMV